MTTADTLKTMLRQQFGPFIREERYRKSFDRALESIDEMAPSAAKIDVFYLFLHQLIIELFDEIDRLHQMIDQSM